jgi:hypothetical protein
MREALASEPSVLRWTPKPRTVCTHTTYLQRNYDANDVAYLGLIVAAPDSMTALAQYQSGRQRVLKGKRKPVEAEPDPHCPQWRDRPERHLTARQMAEEQFSGRSLQRELRRIK